MSTHVYATVPPHPLSVPSDVRSGAVSLIDPEALAAMRARSKDWPDVRWAASQCVDLELPHLGHLKFVAVGPGRSIPCVTDVRLTHWSYYFVGWVHLETGTGAAVNPRIHAEACRLVRERKAATYSDACRVIAARRNRKPQPSAPRAVRLPYADN